ncbi:MAG: CooT family nickel-binding protein [Anaerolineae bacterium]|nr:CooT family nickel-binding protein [Anaerolineae bacterium]MDW8102996.1 CooT family nickel-binding protein [Anaerolineae bacterium]
MCEAKAFLVTDDREEEIMRDVILVQPEGDSFVLINLLGEQKLVRGNIRRIDFLKHTIVLEKK